MQTATVQRLEASRGCVIVTPVLTEERSAGSAIILLENTREKLASHQMLIVSVGEPEICEDVYECSQNAHQWRYEPYWDTIHPTDERLVPDAWVLVKHRQLVPLGDKLFTVKIADVVGIFREDALTGVQA